jgi:hypothetical protein
VPTLIREEGFEVRIYTLDHPPPHVHVAKAGAIVKIDLLTHHVIEIVGTISDRDVKRTSGTTGRAEYGVSEIGMGEGPCPSLM